MSSLPSHLGSCVLILGSGAKGENIFNNDEGSLFWMPRVLFFSIGKENYLRYREQIGNRLFEVKRPAFVGKINKLSSLGGKGARRPRYSRY